MSQQHSSSSTQTEKQQQKTTQKKAHAAEGAVGNEAQEGPEQELEEASREAAGEDATAEFKRSYMVRKLAEITGLRLAQAYWLGIMLNFIGIGLVVAAGYKWGIPTRIPPLGPAMRDRSSAIREALLEARKTREEALRRLQEIENRLAKLDSEIAAMAAAAEAEGQKEEARIREAAKEDERKIVDAAEQEIAAAARLARAELRAYVSELAVALAEKRIHVNAATDQELVRVFVDELGKNGK